MNMELLAYLLWAELALTFVALGLMGVRAFGSHAARLRLHKIATAIMHPHRIFS